MQPQSKTRSTLFLCSTLLSSALLLACSKGHDAADADVDADANRTAPADTAPPDAGYVSPDTVSPQAVAQPATGMDAGGTAETVGLVVAIDQHEIDAARQARSKDIDADVKAYADMLINDHTDDLDKTRAVAMANDVTPGDGAEVQDLKAKGRDSLSTLEAKQGKEYTKAYLAAMVEGHTQALAMLDDRLPDIGNAAIKDHLTKTRAAVQKHLDKAKALQQGQ